MGYTVCLLKTEKKKFASPKAFSDENIFAKKRCYAIKKVILYGVTCLDKLNSEYWRRSSSCKKKKLRVSSRLGRRQQSNLSEISN